MKLYIALIALIVVFSALFVGCAVETPTGNAIVCNKPYILVGSSCCLDANDNRVCDKDETQNPVETPPVPTPPSETVNEFKLSKNDIVSVAGKKFALLDFSTFQGRLEAVVNVDGIERTLYETKKSEIVNGLRVTPLSVDRLLTYIVIKVEPFKLQPDEYFFEVDVDNLFLGKVVRLRDVQDDNGILVQVVDGDAETNVFLMPSDSKVVDGLRITNIDSFYRAVKAERYAILKIANA